MPNREIYATDAKSVATEVIMIVEKAFSHISYTLDNDKYSKLALKMLSNSMSQNIIKPISIRNNGARRLLYSVKDLKSLASCISELDNGLIFSVLYHYKEVIREIESQTYLKKEFLELDPDRVFIDFQTREVKFIIIPVLSLFIEPGTINRVKTWVKDNTDFVDVNEISSDKGLVGPYMTETTTTKTGNTKLFTLTTKNGEFSSFGVNLPEISIFGYDYKTSFSVGSDGLSNTTTVKHTGDDGSTDSVTVKTSAASISGETASTSGDTTTGSGFRLSLNPTKSNDVYSYNTTKVDEYTTKRTEGGWTINSGITDLVIAAAAAAIYFGAGAGAGAAAAGGGGAVIYEFPVKEAGENAAMFFLSLFGLEKLMNECDESV